MPLSHERYLQEVLIDEARLQARIRELGAEISAAYADKPNVILICILKGGVLFLTDLMRSLTIPHEIDFLSVSSYGKGVRSSSGSVRIDMDLSSDVRGKHILLVEDIIDSGLTLSFVMEVLAARKPASISLCALLNKPARRKVDIPIHFVGFDIEDKFVFGYGLDLDELYRNLPFVGVVNLAALQADAADEETP